MICRVVRGVVARVATVIVIGILMLGCAPPPPSSDAGADPSISGCCDWFILPVYFDRPQVCLDKHTDVDELQDHQCRWLSCLGGLTQYESCNCGGELAHAPCR